MDELRVIPRNEPNLLTATEQSSSLPLTYRTHNQNEGKQHHDEAKSQTLQNISPVGPLASQARPPDIPRGGKTAASVDKVLGEDISSTISPSDIGTTPSGSNAASQSMVTREMAISDVLHLLSDHGCKNVTDQLDTSNFSQYPVSSGGYGDVYRGAFHDGTRVAVKCLRLHVDPTEESKKQLKRAAREIYVWSKCNHPNVLGLIGVAQHRDQIAMVSPWMERGSLRHLLLQQKVPDRYKMCAQITDGVAYMHSESMVHGDLKCDNVLVSSDLTPKLTDFGNASLKEYSLQFTNTTSSAGISLNWVAPEMLTGQNHATMESDVYSLGMTMLEVMTGAVPYNGMSHHAIMFAKVFTKALPARPEVHIPSQRRHADLLWSLLEGCWAFNPEDRPSAAEVGERMGQIMVALGSGNPSE